MSSEYTVINIKLDEIYCDHDFNCRGHVSAMSVISLANDIKEHGLDIPITVQPYDKVPGYKYRIIAGHRRFTAFKVNNEDTIPCFIKEVEDEFQARDLNLRENLNRENLTLLQEARSIGHYINNGYNISQVAKRLGRSSGWVEVRKQLMELPKEVQDEADKGVINQNHVKSLYQMRRDPEKMLAALKNLKEQLEKGQKVVHVQKEKSVLDLVKIAKPQTHEINAILDWLHANNLIKPFVPAAKCLSFCAGNISALEFWKAIKTECDNQGLIHTLPDDVGRIING